MADTKEVIKRSPEELPANFPKTVLGLLATSSGLPNALAFAKKYSANESIEPSEIKDAQAGIAFLEEELEPVITILTLAAWKNQDLFENDEDAANIKQAIMRIAAFKEFLATLNK